MSNALPRDTYHHGDCGAASVAAALALLAEGPDGFSLRAVADRIGVAHRAVAAHFGDRTGLEAAVAAAGFDRLRGAMADAATPAAFVDSYARFALAHPHLYDLMMRQSYASFDRHPALRAAGDAFIALTIRMCGDPTGDATANRRAVMRLWMLAHGGLALHRAGVLRGRSDTAFVDELLAVAQLGAMPPGAPQPLWKETETSGKGPD